MLLDLFLTAYDPSDLPGGSLDPMGFERGYLMLADKILPGLTNAAGHPRYLGMMCLGVSLTKDVDAATPQARRAARQETLLRTERYWALANALDTGEATTGALRGVTRAKAEAARVEESGNTRTNDDYRLLLRQARTGVVGMYGIVAESLGFVTPDELRLTPGRGEEMAKAFVEETKMPPDLRKAMQHDTTTVSVESLSQWGQRAHVDGRPKTGEAHWLRVALHENDTRSRMIRRLEATPRRDGENELDWLGRVQRMITRSKGADADLLEFITSILAYEKAFRWALVGFEQLLGLCRRHATGTPALAELANDGVLRDVAAELPRAAQAFGETLTGRVLHGGVAMDDVRRFLNDIAGKDKSSAVVDAIFARHSEVQQGKVVRSQRKLPWLEQRDGCLSLTMARSGAQHGEVSAPEHISAHPYRLAAAERFISATQARR